jgi:hypothetical protein
VKGKNLARKRQRFYQEGKKLILKNRTFANVQWFSHEKMEVLLGI